MTLNQRRTSLATKSAARPNNESRKESRRPGWRGLAATAFAEAHYCPVVERQVGRDKADAGKQLPAMELDLRSHAPCLLPTRGLIEKSLVTDHRLVARPSNWPRQRAPDVPLHMVVGRKADRIFHVPFFERFVQLRLGKGRIGPKDYLLAQRLLAFNLGQQQFLPAGGAMDVAGPQFGGEALKYSVDSDSSQGFMNNIHGSNLDWIRDRV